MASDQSMAELKDMIREVHNDLRKQIRDLRSEVINRVTTVEDKQKEHESRIVALESQIKNELGKVDTVASEIEDRNRRKKNLVFYGIKESEAKEGKDRQLDDAKRLSDIARVLDIAEIEVEKIFRLGKKGDQQTHRPMLVKFSTEEAASSFLRNKTILHNCDDERAKDVYIAKDYTKLQRENRSKRDMKKNEETTGNIATQIDETETKQEDHVGKDDEQVIPVRDNKPRVSDDVAGKMSEGENVDNVVDMSNDGAFRFRSPIKLKTGFLFSPKHKAHISSPRNLHIRNRHLVDQ